MAGNCAVCGKRKNHLNHPYGHKFQDASKPGMNPVSAARRAYLESEEHKEAYARADEDGVCLGHLAGAPGKCLGPLTRHHIVPRSQAGGLPAADTYPVVLLCAWLNDGVQSDEKLRKWAENTTFERDGRVYPFLMKAPRNVTEEVEIDL